MHRCAATHTHLLLLGPNSVSCYRVRNPLVTQKLSNICAQRTCAADSTASGGYVGRHSFIESTECHNILYTGRSPFITRRPSRFHGYFTSGSVKVFHMFPLSSFCYFLLNWTAPLNPGKKILLCDRYHMCKEQSFFPPSNSVFSIFLACIYKHIYIHKVFDFNLFTSLILPLFPPPRFLPSSLLISWPVFFLPSLSTYLQLCVPLAVEFGASFKEYREIIQAQGL